MERNVEVFEKEDRWVVRLFEDGEETEREFEHETFARSWAAGQSVRLGDPMEPVAELLATGNHPSVKMFGG